MTSDHRGVRLERVASNTYRALNERGGQLTMGTGGESADFTPVELLLAAIGGCTAVDVDTITSRRAEPERFRVDVDAEKVRDSSGNPLTDIVVTFRVAFPDGDQGDQARAVLPDIVSLSHDRLCTVSRTVELGTAVKAQISPGR